MIELWKDIVGFEGLYEVSTLGRIQRHKSAPITTRDRPGEIRKPKRTKGGYLRVDLSLNGVKHMVSPHRVMYRAFVGPIPGGWVVHHVDGDKLNNTLDNLKTMRFGEHTSMHNMGNQRAKKQTAPHLRR